jgi:hypothetical protein
MSARYSGAARALLLTLCAALPGKAAAQVAVTMQWVYPVESMFIADFTPYSVGRNPDFLSLTMVEGTGREQTVVLEMTIERETPQRTLMFTGATDPFLLQGVRRVTNRDLTTTGSDVALDHYDISDAGEQLVETGRLPAGTYLFSARVLAQLGVELGSAQLRLEIGNPSRIEPLAPGSLVGDAPTLVTTPSPRFLWSSDGAIGGAPATYTLRVVRADGAASAEEAMQGFASWQTVTTTTSAIYPGSAAALPLEPGGTYAWQVTRDVRTTAGVERVESPIYWFTVAASASGTSGASTSLGSAAERAMRSRLEQLYRALGLAELTGFYRVTGLTVDGRSMPIDGVEELLAAIAAGEVPLLSIRVR